MKTPHYRFTHPRLPRAVDATLVGTMEGNERVITLTVRLKDHTIADAVFDSALAAMRNAGFEARAVE